MNLGFTEMMFLFLLALLIFGPRKLPEIGRQIGKGLSEFKRASNEFKSQIETEVRDLELKEEVERRIEAPAADPNSVARSTMAATPPAGAGGDPMAGAEPAEPPETAPRSDAPHA